MLSETRPAKVGKWTEPALRVLRERYLTRQGGEVVETPEEMCWRVALTIARGEARYGRSEAAVREIAEAFYDIMIEGDFLPNSPTLMNAGKGNGLQYSACYVLPVGDSMEEIFDSVTAAATDRFMDALASGGEYELIDPHSGEVTGRLLAKEVFDRMVRAAWRTGDPGMVFIDRINASPANPTPSIGTVEATNPCGEQPLLPNEACNLGSLNVSKFARRSDAGEWSIDWDEMERVVRLAVRFLDDVIEMNPYPLPVIDETVKANRRIGLGIMGWADLLFTMGLPYDSQEAIKLADR